MFTLKDIANFVCINLELVVDYLLHYTSHKNI